MFDPQTIFKYSTLLCYSNLLRIFTEMSLMPYYLQTLQLQPPKYSNLLFEKLIRKFDSLHIMWSK